jgi:hypothetical protein
VAAVLLAVVDLALLGVTVPHLVALAGWRWAPPLPHWPEHLDLPVPGHPSGVERRAPTHRRFALERLAG